MAQKFNAPFGTGGKTVSKPMAKAPMEAGAAVAEEAPEQVAQQHGPAVQINVEHEHEMGSHHVHSVHADRHEHHKDHASAEEAHEHAKKLAGIGGAQQEHGGEEEQEPWGSE